MIMAKEIDVLINTLLDEERPFGIGENVLLPEAIPMLTIEQLPTGGVPKILSISNGTDLNTARTSGWSRLGGSGLYVNGPLGNAGHFGIFIVYSDNTTNGMCKQEYTHESGAVYSRMSKTNGVFTAWVKII